MAEYRSNGKCAHGFPITRHINPDEWVEEYPSSNCRLCPRGKPLTCYKEPSVSPFVCVLSGGQDSATALAWALNEYGKNPKSVCVFFNYGQRHLEAEQEAMIKVAKHFKMPYTRVEVSSLKSLGDSALTDHSKPITESEERDGLPSTFTPGRNQIFLTLAASLAYKLGHEKVHLITGVCQTDYSGYPDCRRAFVDAFEKSTQEALDREVQVDTPLMELTKRETVLLMQELGHLDVYEHTHTCYEGKRPPCTQCPACILRQKGFLGAGLMDPLLKVSPTPKSKKKKT